MKKRVSVISISLLLILATAIIVGMLNSEYDSQSVVIRRTTAKIFVDGNLDEADWKKASVVGKFLLWPSKSSEEEERTEAKMLWDAKNLYIAFKAYDKHISATRTQRNSDVYRDDCVEAFISPYPNKPEIYTNIEINALGTYLSQIHLTEKNAMLKKAPGVADPEDLHSSWILEGLQIGRSHEGSINDESDEDSWWIIEVCVPFSIFRFLGQDSPPKEGDIWRFNLYRLGGNINPKRRNLFYIPEGKNNHSPDHFGKLIFSR